MQDFQSGAFEYRAGQCATLAGVPSIKWVLYYGHEQLAWHYLPETAARSEIREEFSGDISDFERRHQPAARRAVSADALSPMFVQLVEEASGRVLGGFEAEAPIAGLASGLIDDRWPTWLVTTTRPLMSMPMGMDEFERLAAAHNAVRRVRAEMTPAPAALRPHAWIAGLLPGHVLSLDADEWRAPTAWEIRHVVGEGSFTGVTGAKAAALVGVLPQSFRKYTAADGAASRQNMSFAMWHLLLHRLDVQRLS
ncbi:hypothetical protein [Pantoea sp. 18069]|uniref:hypothetical protein n=1 Tax=Pantoea sp. 18069 TaxID=2681415 RepID=UPI001356D995|nr:hypothetical protein [Pantoea sp. 18069]